MSNKNFFVLGKYNALEKRITLYEKKAEKNKKIVKPTTHKKIVLSLLICLRLQNWQKNANGKKNNKLFCWINTLSLLTTFFFTGSPVLCYGVCQWWRSHVQNSAGREIQRTSGCVRESPLISNISFDISSDIWPHPSFLLDTIYRTGLCHDDIYTWTLHDTEIMYTSTLFCCFFSNIDSTQLKLL